MTNEEAKFILGAYRPNGRDAGGEIFADALRQSQQDPALGAWFERQRAHDSAVSAKLAAIAPPAGLRDAILAGARVSEARSRGTRQLGLWLGLAAVIAVAVGLALVRVRRTDAVSNFAQFALADARDESRHGGRGGAEKALQAALSDPHDKVEALRVDFHALASTGCRTIEFSGSTVLEVCFQRNGTWFHCYVARCSDLPQLTAHAAPTYASAGRMNAMTWADGTYRFVVAGDAPRDALAALL